MAVPIEEYQYENHGSLKMTSPMSFYRSHFIGKIELKMTIRMLVYTSGSFRQFDSYIGDNLCILNSITNLYIEQNSSAISSSTGKYPTTLIDYWAAGTIASSEAHSVSSSIGMELLSLGFTKSTTNFYRRWFELSGSISM